MNTSGWRGLMILVLGIVLGGSVVGSMSGAEAVGPDHDIQPYASSTYHPYWLGGDRHDTRITITTHQICSPNDIPVILHDIASVGVFEEYTFSYSRAGTHTEEFSDGTGSFVGNKFVWRPTYYQPNTRIIQVGGSCAFSFPYVSLDAIPAFITLLPDVGVGRSGLPVPYPRPVSR